VAAEAIDRVRPPPAAATAGAAPRCRSVPAHRAPSAGGPRFPDARPTRPGAPTRSPRHCSTGTASSSAARSWASARRADSPRSTACSRPSRRPGAAEGATSSRASAPRSSLSPEPSTGCEPWLRRPSATSPPM